MSAWIIVIAGVAVWLIGQKIPPPKKSKGTKIGPFFSILGMCVFALGVYAGFKGPLKIGPKTVRPFSFAHAGSEARSDALLYARNHMLISSTPSPGWHGASKDDLRCKVVNTGDKSVQKLIFSFATTDHQTFYAHIRGPYPPNSTKHVLVALPKNVLRSYFEAPGMNVNQISGAHF